MIKQVVMTISLLLPSVGSLSASHHPQDFLKKIAGSKTEGRDIVEHYCALCHAEKPMVQLGAPTLKDKKAWASRIKQGMDTLFQHTNEGFNAMPPRGGCFECTDQQLLMAIMAMLHEEKLQ